MRATVAADRDEARRFVLEDEAVRPKLLAMDRETQMDEMRRLGAAPDYMLGSVHAVTEDGSHAVASASGSQIGPHSSSAVNQLLVTNGDWFGRTMMILLDEPLGS